VRERPKAKIKYFVKTVLHCEGIAHNMKYKQVLIIREPPVPFKVGEQQQETSKVTTWCCIDQGISAMWSAFEKNIYTPQEIAKAMIHVDNSRCQLAVTRCKFFIEQRMTIRSRGIFNHVYNTTRRLVERDVPGPGAGVGNWQTELLLDLS